MAPFRVLATGLLGMLIFLYGFLPMKIMKGNEEGNQSLPVKINGISVNASLLYKPAINRLVLMVIDALRDDFVTGSDSSQFMPYLSSVINLKEGILFTSLIEPPTVTLPRIKALTMGLIPNYADVILNVFEKDASGLKEESIVGRALSSHRKIIFYGDDTWLRLFPDSFLRAEGTTSFYVSDYTEVDNNVTRHIDQELEREDWDIMILHYLGLDHIGHTHGPYSHLIPPKLTEMDRIIQKIHQGLKKWEPSTLLVVCGDHGMKDTGGHGGASLSETRVPLLFLSPLLSPAHGCPGNSNGEVVNQRDLAPTLSALLGLPPPSGNVGCALTPVLRCALPHHTNLLYALHVNAWQVAALLNSSVPIDGYILYQEASKLHSEWISLKGDRGGVQDEESSQLMERIIQLYSLSISEMTSKFAETFIKFDYYAMFLGGLITWQAFLTLFLDKETKYPGFGKCLTLTFLMLSVHFIVCSTKTCSNSIFCKQGLLTVLSLIIIGIISLNMLLLLSGNNFLFSYNIKRKWDEIIKNPLHSLFVAGGFLHAVSLASSSFIEEEHQTWQFLCISVIVLELALICGRNDCGRTLANKKLLWMYAFLLLSHRALRDWNRTGDKWGSLPDLTDWISRPKNIVTRSLVMGLSLVALVFVLQQYSVIKPQLGNVLLSSISAYGIYAYRAAVGDVFTIFSYTSSRGILEFNLFLFSLVLLLANGCFVAYKLSIEGYENKGGSSCAIKEEFWVAGDKTANVIALAVIMQHICTVWILFCSILKRPCDIPVVVVYLLSCHTLTHSLAKKKISVLSGANVQILSFMYVWLGIVFYFHQGNSNSLASIDLQAGYVGQENYDAVTVGFLLFCHTFSMPISSLLLLFHSLVTLACRNHIFNAGYFEGVLHGAGEAVVFARLLPIAIYLPLVTIQRHHLFIWTVFSPKLIYEASLTLATLLGLTFLPVLQLTVFYFYK